ncbi:polyketide cyclase [Rhodobacterales bacterium HKCCE4037]|nr:polyketide cyclase [Rhodobacterales bacterium HKCCE4037]
MTSEPNITHDSFTLTREIAASPAQVFACWADPMLKRRWFVESDGPEWQTADYALDFRTGGTETGRFELSEGPGAGEHRQIAHFLDIADDHRIVYAYTMAINGRIHSASLATVTFASTGSNRTHLTFHEQMTVIGDSDGVKGRRHGWIHLLNALEHTLKEAA